MHLDGSSIDSFIGKEGGNLDTLVTLELDDLAHLLVVDECAVAGELLNKQLAIEHRRVCRWSC